MNGFSSTYRIQLHKNFTFRDMEQIIDYLKSMGVSAVYAAPMFSATPGSLHGYDVVDSNTINPEIGTAEQFDQLSEKVKSRSMQWLQDIVPNHMAFHPNNFRLMDVFERGDRSEFYRYFDIDWDHHSSDLKGKVIAPVLGKPLSQCIADGEIKLDFTKNGISVNYFSTSYPLSVPSYELLQQRSKNAFSFESILASYKKRLSYLQWNVEKPEALKVFSQNENIHLQLLEYLENASGDVDFMSQLLNNQFYLLTHWKDSERVINYRRFFTVNELICLRVEDETVFSNYHQLIKKLYDEKKIHGLRIDHIDGLQEPGKYTRDLRKLFGEDCYIIAEKILEAKEVIPKNWPLQGTSGYEFLSNVSQLMTNRKGAKQLLDFYKSIVPDTGSYQEIVSNNKRLILEHYMAGEWDNLAHLFFELSLNNDFRFDRVKEAIAAFMVSLPVYRIYPEDLPIVGDDFVMLKSTIEKGIIKSPQVTRELEFFRDIFLNQDSPAPVEKSLQFLKRIMQFTGPLTAKGVEDTTFYNYNALISHDEVGDSPQNLGISISRFHAEMIQRQLNSPLSLNTTATHDTKRGEDARIRLNVLCDFPEDWISLCRQSISDNTKLKLRTSKGILAPMINDEYFIYQSLVAGLPEDFTITETFLERVSNYITKVLREAKKRSDWGDPDLEYEQASIAFIRAITSPESSFMKTFLPFMKNIVSVANRYSLGQTLIKITSPGIPDTYQGCELWDLSYVDPDNRRPVDYSIRQKLLNELIEKEREGASILFSFINGHSQTGIAKLFTTWKALSFRRKYPRHFAEGEYLPLHVTGKDSVCVSYARISRNEWIIVLVPLKADNDNYSHSDEEVILPGSAPARWKNIFTNEEVQSNGSLLLSLCLSQFPVAMLSSFHE
jgi:(1->4)-alpha-D-glucan 1-alpha-D-glucosylmutase